MDKLKEKVEKTIENMIAIRIVVLN